MESFTIKINAVVPAPIMDSAHFRGKLMAGLQRIGRLGVTYCKGTVSTWTSVKPEFSYNFTYSGGDAEVSVGTDDDIWHYIDEGTSERWAVMRPMFESKTQPGQLQAGPGLRNYDEEGRYTVIRGRRAMLEKGIGPMPGIEARDFSGQIMDLLGEELDQEISDLLDEALG